MTNRKQHNAKARRHSVDMSLTPPDDPGWEPADGEVVEQIGPFDTYMSDDDRIAVRMDRDAGGVLVGFAMWQEVLWGGDWHKVSVIDSRHGLVHRHQYGRSTGGRVGERESIKKLACRDDVQDGYTVSHRMMVDDWSATREAWEHA